MELLAPPALELAVVAFGTLQLQTKKDARGLGGELGGFALVIADEGGLRVGLDVPLGGQDGPHSLVPGNPLIELARKPVLEPRVVEKGKFRRRHLGANRLAPIVGPVRAAILAREKPINDARPPVRTGIPEKSVKFFASRRPAHSVLAGPPQKLLIRHGRKIFQARSFPGQQGVQLNGGQPSSRRIGPRARAGCEAKNTNQNEHPREHGFLI